MRQAGACADRPATLAERIVIGPSLLPWNRRYALKSYVSGSMWLVPLIALLVYALFHRLVHTVDAWLVARDGPTT